MTDKATAESILEHIIGALTVVLSTMQTQYSKPSKLDPIVWLSLEKAIKGIFVDLKTIRDTGGSSMEEGTMLHWNWDKSMSSTRESSLNGWTIKHDWFLYDVFTLVPPVHLFQFDTITCGREFYALTFERELYNADTPNSINMNFRQDSHCNFANLRDICIDWYIQSKSLVNSSKRHRDNGLPSSIRITKNKVTLEYYVHDLRHDDKHYYGFDAQENKDGIMEIRCPECDGTGQSRYVKRTPCSSLGGLGWTPFTYMEETPYEDTCHMCCLPLESKARGWITITPQNKEAIQWMALKDDGSGLLRRPEPTRGRRPSRKYSTRLRQT